MWVHLSQGRTNESTPHKRASFTRELKRSSGRETCAVNMCWALKMMLLSSFLVGFVHQKKNRICVLVTRRCGEDRFTYTLGRCLFIFVQLSARGEKQHVRNGIITFFKDVMLQFESLQDN